jgi:hypothetical protein
VSILVWAMIGIALWHLAVLVPDRFVGGIIGAFIAATAGALVAGYLLPAPGVPAANPPGVMQAVWALPGSLAALLASYFWGARRERRSRDPGRRRTAR